MKGTAKQITALILLVWVALLLAGCGGTYEPTDKNGVAQCYRMEFGVPPPAEVANIHGKQIIIGDGARAWLRFQATPALVDSLLKRGFKPTNRETFNMHSGGANTPKWWTPDSNQVTVFYGFGGWRLFFFYAVI